MIKMFTVLEARMSSSENEVEELKKENAGKIHKPLLEVKCHNMLAVRMKLIN